MTKRQKIRLKFNGLCAYSGKPLGEDWQVDHVLPKCFKLQSFHKIKSHNDFDNLVPACRIVNHYKRSFDLEGFRIYMRSFHLRLAKLPKNTKVPRTQKRKEYLMKVAQVFDITPEKPFSGIFYFETLTPSDGVKIE